MSNESRAAFEAWFASPKKLETILDGSYRYMPAHTAWLTWQASRKVAIEEALDICKNASCANQSASNCYNEIKELIS